MTEGTATARPATVVTSASATPGATAAMFPEPLTAMPMNASITPSTVPNSPSSGLTEPKRSEEHTSELQSLAYLVCRLLLEKKKAHIQLVTRPDGMATQIL